MALPGGRAGFSEDDAYRAMDALLECEAELALAAYGAVATLLNLELYPHLVLIHLPVHASWLDQIEIYSSILQRRVLTPSDSLSLDELGRRILDFQARYERSATPFEWKFTRRDLVALLRSPRTSSSPLRRERSGDACANL